MDPSTPAQLTALHYAPKEFRRPRGRPWKPQLCIMKQELKNELSMNCNEVFDVVKDENICKTLIKDYPMQQILQF